MPVAGPRAADRAVAHYKWSERYSRAGNTDKSMAHFGRALDFGGGTMSEEYIRDVRSVASGYVQRAFGDAGERGAKVSFSYDPKEPSTAYVHVAIALDRKEAVKGWYVQLGGMLHVENTLRVIGDALDKCAVELGLDADVRVSMQQRIHEAYILCSMDRVADSGIYYTDRFLKRKGNAGDSIRSSAHPE